MKRGKGRGAGDLAAGWDAKADDWDLQVGDEGDANRRLASDPVLWRLLGEVTGLEVLDAGCGTGYLSRELARRGARVTGVDFSERMVAVARERAEEADLAIDHRVDDCEALGELPDAGFDRFVSNYVLMDLADLDAAARAHARVTRPGGAGVLVLSHPCFPQAEPTTVHEDGTVEYRWEQPYFKPTARTNRPWAHFTSTFRWFHRPLSVYFRALRSAGFAVTDLEEPRLERERYDLAEDEQQLFNYRTRPFSIALRVERSPRA